MLSVVLSWGTAQSDLYSTLDKNDDGLVDEDVEMQAGHHTPMLCAQRSPTTSLSSTLQSTDKAGLLGSDRKREDVQEADSAAWDACKSEDCAPARKSDPQPADSVGSRMSRRKSVGRGGASRAASGMLDMPGPCEIL